MLYNIADASLLTTQVLQKLSLGLKDGFTEWIVNKKNYVICSKLLFAQICFTISFSSTSFTNQ